MSSNRHKKPHKKHGHANSRKEHAENYEVSKLKKELSESLAREKSLEEKLETASSVRTVKIESVETPETKMLDKFMDLKAFEHLSKEEQANKLIETQEKLNGLHIQKMSEENEIAKNSPEYLMEKAQFEHNKSMHNKAFNYGFILILISIGVLVFGSMTSNSTLIGIGITLLILSAILMFIGFTPSVTVQDIEKAQSLVDMFTKTNKNVQEIPFLKSKD